ncbi:hypothetical protein H072_1596 [Dactylellina haptotyla CBS 200.50]|uniref:F-box domain-containing protein n=1 Tax=Dactylellina haptotyla (strain CBS 200.50) TaxID=1284197 RepID=S8ANI2_DACHA|nr:hypothetical protein H072_1596 [Dactylellina haptotyla CBS 200.50]
MGTLPPEIVEDIVEMLRRHDLAMLARVNRRFNEHCKRIIYQKIVLRAKRTDPNPSFPEPWSTILTLGGPSGPKYIKHLLVLCKEGLVFKCRRNGSPNYGGDVPVILSDLTSNLLTTLPPDSLQTFKYYDGCESSILSHSILQQFPFQSKSLTVLDLQFSDDRYHFKAGERYNENLECLLFPALRKFTARCLLTLRSVTAVLHIVSSTEALDECDLFFISLYDDFDGIMDVFSVCENSLYPCLTSSVRRLKIYQGTSGTVLSSPPGRSYAVTDLILHNPRNFPPLLPDYVSEDQPFRIRRLALTFYSGRHGVNWEGLSAFLENLSPGLESLQLYSRRTLPDELLDDHSYWTRGVHRLISKQKETLRHLNVPLEQSPGDHPDWNSAWRQAVMENDVHLESMTITWPISTTKDIRWSSDYEGRLMDSCHVEKCPERIKLVERLQTIQVVTTPNIFYETETPGSVDFAGSVATKYIADCIAKHICEMVVGQPRARFIIVGHEAREMRIFSVDWVKKDPDVEGGRDKFHPVVEQSSIKQMEAAKLGVDWVEAALWDTDVPPDYYDIVTDRPWFTAPTAVYQFYGREDER